MILFALFLTYEGEREPRKIADGCNKLQLFDVLSKNLMSANVAHFQIVPFEHYVPFREYIL